MDLVAIDLDGTLLNSQHEIPAENKAEIARLAEMGINIVIATGRSMVSAQEMVQNLGVKASILALNGTYIAEVLPDHSLKVLRRSILDKAVLKQALALAEVKEITFIASNETGSDRVVFNEAPEVVQEFLGNRPDLRVITKEAMDQKLADSSTEYFKVSFTDTNVEKLHDLRRALDGLGLETIFSDTFYIEIVPEGVNKGDALAFVCEYLNVPLTETVAFGDQENDIEMLQAAGVGVAMGNAKENVKQHADAVTSTNDQAGVAEMLRKLFK